MISRLQHPRREEKRNSGPPDWRAYLVQVQALTTTPQHEGMENPGLCHFGELKPKRHGRLADAGDRGCGEDDLPSLGSRYCRAKPPETRACFETTPCRSLLCGSWAQERPGVAARLTASRSEGTKNNSQLESEPLVLPPISTRRLGHALSTCMTRLPAGFWAKCLVLDLVYWVYWVYLV